MPELPEVETIASELIDSGLIGKEIKEVNIYWERSVATPAPELFCKQLKGQKILEIGRRGKFLQLTLSTDTLLIHLRMSGRLQLIEGHEEPHKHERLSLVLNNGHSLVFIDPRKFGRWYLLKNPEEQLAKLGPEPLGEKFTVAFLTKLMHSKSRQIKALLLDQSSVAGLGNIYVDEALWLAKLHPQTLSNQLTHSQIANLHAAILKALQKGLDAAGTSLGSGPSNFYRLSGKQGAHQEQLHVFRRTGLPCPRCKTPIQRLIAAGRSSHICPACQK